MSTNPGRIGKYELQERLGQSGITEVWKAFDTQANRYAALKFFHANLQADPEFVARFQREAPVIVSLRHPNIVQYYDFSISQLPGATAATAFLAMDYVDGGTLASYIYNTSHGGKLLAIPEVVRLFTSIGMAVDFAHQRGIAHGNLKPSNILLDKRNTSRNVIGEPMVADFGVARLVGAAVGSASDWWNSSPLYISPEQVMNTPANERSDIYSLGIMLYELCTGTLPFLGSNPAAIMMQHVHTIPASPSLINPNLPPALSAVIMRCIAKDPTARFPSASAMVAALADVTRQGSFNISTPEIVGQSSGPVHSMEMNMPTVISTKMSPLPAGVGSSAPIYSSNVPVGGISQPYPMAQSGGPITPLVPAYTSPYTTGNQPGGISMPPPTAPSSKKPGRRGLYIALAALLILALIGSALGAYFAFFSKGATTPQIVGHAYFVSSGLLNASSFEGISNEGITDQLQINLQNIPPPQPGKAYYAWLLSEKNKPGLQPIALGPLTVGDNLFYSGADTQRADLLASYNRLLITEEDAAIKPTSNSFDPNAWVYYAEFSQIPIQADPKHYSLYDHIRHLLAEDPKVRDVGKLTGGLDTWLYRNTQKILEWAGSARDQWSYQNADSAKLINRQLTRIEDYLEGVSYVQQDLQKHGQVVGPGQFIDANFSKFSQIGLLTPIQTQDPPGYLKHIDSHLAYISALPQTSEAQKALAIQIKQAIDRVNYWLQTIHDDVVKLLPMTSAQLFTPEGQSKLNEIATFANYAFAGQVDPHDQVIDGVVQIHYNIQRLATFDIRACTASNPCALS
jgi:eukaryotic-like serine/threonine-protein kinase